MLLYVVRIGLFVKAIRSFPCSPVFADLILEILEDEVLSKLKSKIPILTVVPADKVNEIKYIFNKYNTHIQFTIEEEVNGQISLLEVLCIRQVRSIITDWFYKDTGHSAWTIFKF